MSQEVWLLRHGDAEPGEGDDAGRRLTEKGERQSRAAGSALAALGLEFDAVLSSPRVRALDTARLVVEALGAVPLEAYRPLSGSFDADDLTELLGGLDPDARILLVGHEPDFSRLVNHFTGGRIEMKKGGIASVRVERGRGDLLVLLRPRDVQRIG